MTSFDNVDEKSVKKVKKYGYKEEKTKGKHEVARFKKDATLILYTTGKLLVQGSKENVEEAVKLVKYLNIPKISNCIRGCAIGSDETLKGDTFGGLVVAGFKADDEIREKLVDMFTDKF